jgi:hypothetical protein
MSQTVHEDLESAQGPNTTRLTNPAHSSPYQTDDSPTGGVAATTQTISSTATLSYPQEGNEQQDIVAPCAEPDISQILSIASTPTPTPTLVPVPTSAPPVLGTLLESCDSGATSASNSLLTATSVVVGFSNPVSAIPCSILAQCRVYCPAQQYDILLSHRQCHTSAPMCSWTRKFWEYVLRECSVANSCAFPSLLELFQETGKSEGAARRGGSRDRWWLDTTG